MFMQIKPDGVQRGLVGEVIKRFEQRGYTLRALKVRLWMDKHNWLDPTSGGEGRGPGDGRIVRVASAQRGGMLLRCCVLRPPALFFLASCV